MKLLIKKSVYIVLISVLVLSCLSAFSPDFSNRLTLQGYEDLTAEGVKVEAQVDLLSNLDIDIYQISSFEIFGQVSGKAELKDLFSVTENENDVEVDLYRAWLRLGNHSTTLKLGLQQINFGSAQIHRPLQWFDYIDPLDSSEETEGVYAVLFRKYFLNGANIWLWGILAEKKPSENEYLTSKKNSLETGGRIQYPLSRGETALSFDFRKVEMPDNSDLPVILPEKWCESNEYRFGFDTRLDFEFGLWTEYSLSYYEKNGFLEDRFQSFGTVGIDYTFAWGNGLYALCEFSVIDSDWDIEGIQDFSRSLTSLMLDYPLNLLDKIVILSNYDWKDKLPLQTILFRRTYDYLSLELSYSHQFGKSDGSVNQIKVQINYNF
ncbi:MAG: hypothetical protein PHR06_13575 [Candidatus Cloacimonetes bacterium]|nr:hypothetical protein [Candidatus Cloacimonadota bacterium]